MAAEVVLQFRSDLEERLSRKKSQLDATEESIRRYVAFPRDDGFPQRTTLKSRLGPPPGRRDGDQVERRPFRTSLESRLGPKPSQETSEAPRRLMSTVVADHKTRDEAIKEQPLDKQDALRGKRIFGRLLGTLQQFCQDENKSQDRLLKKRKIELKIEEKTEKEKEEAILKKRELFSERKKQQRELRELEAQLLRTEQFELWEKSKLDEMKFMHTQKGTLRQISFLPKEHNALTQKALEESVARIEEEIRARKELFETDITVIGKKNADGKEEPAGSGDEDSENLKPSTRISSTVRVVDDVLDNQEESGSEDEGNDAFGLDSVNIEANLVESSDNEDEEKEPDVPRGGERDRDNGAAAKGSEDRANLGRRRRPRSASTDGSSTERRERKKSPPAARKKRSPRTSSSD